MTTRLTIIALGGLLLAQAVDVEELVQKDRDRLQGTWKVISAESKGERVPARDIAGMALLIDGDSIRVREAGKVHDRYRYKINPARKPKEINFTYVAGPKKGRTDRGIYAFQGDRLLFCIQEEPLSPRPGEFATDPDTALFLVILERVKKP